MYVCVYLYEGFFLCEFMSVYSEERTGNTYLCMYVCTHHIYMCACAHACVLTRNPVTTYVCTRHVYVCVYVHAYFLAQIYAQIYVYTYTCTYERIHQIYAHIELCVCMCVCVYMNWIHKIERDGHRKILGMHTYILIQICAYVHAVCLCVYLYIYIHIYIYTYI